MKEYLDLGMWSRDENVGQSDTGQASVPVDELYRTEEENCIMAYKTSVMMKIKCGKPLY